MPCVYECVYIYGLVLRLCRKMSFDFVIKLLTVLATKQLLHGSLINVEFYVHCWHTTHCISVVYAHAYNTIPAPHTGTTGGLMSRVKESAGTVQSILQSKVDQSRPMTLDPDAVEHGELMWRVALQRVSEREDDIGY